MSTKTRKIANRRHHSITLGAKKKTDFSDAVAAAKRARKPENKDVATQMANRGYIPTIKAIQRWAKGSTEFFSSDFKRAAKA